MSTPPEDGQNELALTYMRASVELLQLNARSYRYLLLPEAYLGVAIYFLTVAAIEFTQLLWSMK